MVVKNRSSEEWHNFVSSNPWKICIVPKNMISTHMLREAVQKDGGILEFIRSKNCEYMIQNDIYELAVQNKGSSIEFVPEDCITDRMCHNAVHGSQGKGSNLQYIPKKLRTPDLCKECVNQNLYNIVFVPAEFLNKEMYISVIEEKIELLDHISLANMNEEIAKYAIDKGFDFNKLPEHLKSGNPKESCVSSAFVDIQYIPKDFLTKDICKYALEKSPEVFEHIPKEFIDKEMIEILLKHDGKIKFTKE
jgi:hypothetical protein